MFRQSPSKEPKSIHLQLEKALRHLANCLFPQNLVSAGSELLDSSKHSIWLELNQVCTHTHNLSHVTPVTFSLQSAMSTQVMALLTGLENLGQQLFLQTNTSGSIIISSDNVGRFGTATIYSCLVRGTSQLDTVKK